jgi:hypothetical protein
MGVSVLTLRVGKHLMGLDFGLVERIDDQRDMAGPDSGGGEAPQIRGATVRDGNEIMPLKDLREIFGAGTPGASGVYVWSATRRVWVADEALEVVECEPGDLHPLPEYLFEKRRPFRGIFPYGEDWGLLLEEENL